MSWLGLVPGVLSVVSGLFGGNAAAQQNAALQGKADDLYGKQQGAIDSMTGYAGPMQGLINQQQGLLGGYDQLSGGLGSILAQFGGQGGGPMMYPSGAGTAGQAPGVFGQNGGSLQTLLHGIQPGMPMGQWMADPSKAPAAGSGGAMTSGAAPAQGQGLFEQLAQLYSSVQNQRPITASDNGAGGALMGNAAGVLNATDPSVYKALARQQGADVLGQLNADAASRGVGGAGATSRTGAGLLAKIYAQSDAQGQADRLQAYGISNQALSSAGGLGLQQSQLANSLQNDHAGLLSSLINQRAGLLGQQAGIIGQQGNLLGQHLSGLAGLNGQYQGIAGLYGNAAGMYGNAAGSLLQQQNPNPYGGMGAGLGSLGTALAALFAPK